MIDQRRAVLTGLISAEGVSRFGDAITIGRLVGGFLLEFAGLETALLTVAAITVPVLLLLVVVPPLKNLRIPV